LWDGFSLVIFYNVNATSNSSSSSKGLGSFGLLHLGIHGGRGLRLTFLAFLTLFFTRFLLLLLLVPIALLASFWLLFFTLIFHGFALIICPCLAHFLLLCAQWLVLRSRYFFR